MSSAHRPPLAAHQPHRAGHLPRLHRPAQLHLPAGLVGLLAASAVAAVELYALAFASQHLHVPPVDRPVIEAVDRT